MNLYPACDNINSQVNEQQNRSTQHLAAQLSYMTAEHFMQHAAFFLWYKNEEKRNAMEKKKMEDEKKRQDSKKDKVFIVKL